jgi:hypothetical protein
VSRVSPEPKCGPPPVLYTPLIRCWYEPGGDDRLAPWVEVIEELVQIVVERLRHRPFELVGADLDLLAERPSGVGAGEAFVKRKDTHQHPGACFQRQFSCLPYPPLVIRRFRSTYTSRSPPNSGSRGRYRGGRGGGDRTSLQWPPDKSSNRIGLTSLCTLWDGV